MILHKGGQPDDTCYGRTYLKDSHLIKGYVAAIPLCTARDNTLNWKMNFTLNLNLYEGHCQYSPWTRQDQGYFREIMELDHM